ncbi:MAG: phosphatase PAP2 family protein [Bacteroidetes bacterium]|nr:phosphatase PAP2 family protein [Bacteroidota bacterium]
MKKLLPVLCCLIALRSVAAVPCDSGRHSRLQNADTIKAASFIVPAALAAYGGLSFAVHPIRRLDYYLDGKLRPGIKTTVATYLVFTPIAAVYGLNLAGVPGKNNFVDRTALIALTACFGGAADFSLKHIIGRPGPGGFETSSFPSGHTIGVFAAAEFLAEEYGDTSPGYTVAGYTVAIVTGTMRMYTHNHWFSDVVAGAGIGIASTKLAYLVYPCVKKWLTRDNGSGKSTFIMPTYQDGMPGFAFAKTF